MKKVLLFVMVLVLSMCLVACIGEVDTDNDTHKDGLNGADGKSAYQIWLDNGYTGNEGDFLNWLKGQDGKKGNAGDDGKSAYQIWLDNGYTGNEGDFLNWLKGQSETNGKSAYQIYKDTYGYDGTEQEWLIELIKGTLAEARLTVTFDTNGADSDDIEPLSIVKGDKIPKPANPTKTGYAFDGWYISDSFLDEENWTFLSHTVTSDLTLYAKWKVATYTLIFDGNGGSPVPAPKEVNFGATMPSISVLPQRANYSFVGFFDSLDKEKGTMYYDSDLSKVVYTWDKTTNMTLYAIWESWDGVGTGTQEDPYNVSTKEQLITLANQVNNENEKFSGKFFEVRKNIDLDGMEWTPIGVHENLYFDGTFNGNGYVISNFVITTTQAYAGLFGYSKGQLKNIGVENFTISGAFDFAGGLVGQSYSSLITNCYATGSLTATSANNISSCAYIGGLVGQTFSSIINCYSTSDIIATGDVCVGGLVGQSYSSFITITNSYATGNVKATGTGIKVLYTGGLVGQFTSSTITNCYATGSVTAIGADSVILFVGGLVGHFSISSITKSYATGDVVAEGASDIYTGGLVGYCTSAPPPSSITDCYATGDVKAKGSGSKVIYAGGLIGQSSPYSSSHKVTVTNSYAAGNVTAEGIADIYAGGLIGQSFSHTLIINSYAAGNVSASTTGLFAFIGGLTGLNNGTVSSSYRYISQVFYRKQNSIIYSTANEAAGEICTSQNLSDKDFHTTTLGWSASIWNFDDLDFENEKYPTLKI